VTYLDAEEGVNVSLDYEAWPGMYIKTIQFILVYHLHCNTFISRAAAVVCVLSLV
jgi:hypothetical protein